MKKQSCDQISNLTLMNIIEVLPISGNANVTTKTRKINNPMDQPPLWPTDPKRDKQSFGIYFSNKTRYRDNI